MKNFTITYKKGHLIDQETGKRILLTPGKTFTIQGDDSDFQQVDKLNHPIQPLDSKSKMEELEKKHKDKKLFHIARPGDKFIYRIGIRKKEISEEDREYLFEAEILEDLFFYNPGKDKRLRMCPCICKTEHCIEGDIQMIEPVYGESLNQLFSNMVAFYFNMQRSGSCNVFTTFFFKPKHEAPVMQMVRDGLYYSLDRVRREIQEKEL